MVGRVAAPAYEQLLSRALTSHPEAVNAAYAVLAAPLFLADTQVELMEHLGLETALLVEHLIAVAAPQVVISVRLIVADCAPVTLRPSALLGDRGPPRYLTALTVVGLIGYFPQAHSLSEVLPVADVLDVSLLHPIAPI